MPEARARVRIHDHGRTAKSRLRDRAVGGAGGDPRHGAEYQLPGHENDYVPSGRRWGKPSDGGRPLTGFGLLFWRTSDPDPAYSSALVKGDPAARSHVFTGLQPDTTYKFRIHACNGPDSCGWWTHPPKEASTLPTPTPTATATAAPVGRPDRPHTLSFDEIKATSARANWNIAANTGGVALTGFGLLRWPTGTAEPPHSEAIVVGDGGPPTRP